MSPKPAGPRRRAKALLRTIPAPTFRSEEPPISADDLRICP
jgi:hypothetical protein